VRSGSNETHEFEKAIQKRYWRAKGARAKEAKLSYSGKSAGGEIANGLIVDKPGVGKPTGYGPSAMPRWKCCRKIPGKQGAVDGRRRTKGFGHPRISCASCRNIMGGRRTWRKTTGTKTSAEEPAAVPPDCRLLDKVRRLDHRDLSCSRRPSPNMGRKALWARVSEAGRPCGRACRGANAHRIRSPTPSSIKFAAQTLVHSLPPRDRALSASPRRPRSAIENRWPSGPAPTTLSAGRSLRFLMPTLDRARWATAYRRPNEKRARAVSRTVGRAAREMFSLVYLQGRGPP